MPTMTRLHLFLLMAFAVSCAGATPENTAIEFVKTRKAEEVNSLFRGGAIEWTACQLVGEKDLVVAWSLTQPDIVTYLRQSSTSDVISAAHLQRASGGITAVRTTTLDDGACLAWSGTQPPAIAVSVVANDGTVQETTEYSADTRSLAVAATTNGQIGVLFAEWNSVQLVVLNRMSADKRLALRGKPIVLSANCVLHSPVALDVLEDRFVATWFDQKITDGKTDHGSCQAVLKVLDSKEPLEVVAERKGGQLSMPSWGPPRGHLEIETVAAKDSLGVGVLWTGSGDAKPQTKDVVIPVKSLPLSSR